MNAEEFADIKARHWNQGGFHLCPECEEYTCTHGIVDACDAGRLVAEVERLQKGLRAILREHRPVTFYGHAAHCQLCSPQEKRWPCTTVLEARAALGGEDG